MQRIIFRADGDSKIGLGHITRSLALAEMLKNDFEIVVATQTPSADIKHPSIRLTESNDYQSEATHLSSLINSNDIVVLDGYNFKTAYQKKLKETSCKLVCIDDLAEWHFVADVIINHANDIDHKKYSTEPYTKIFSGSEYALLRKPFIKAALKNREIEKVESVFLSMGGADINNINLKVINGLVNTSQIKNIHAVIGSVNPHYETIKNYISEKKIKHIHLYKNLDAEQLGALMQKCDLAICPASSLSMEVCAVKMFMVSGHTANNQLNILKGLESKGALINIGDLNDLTEQDWETEIKKILLNKHELEPQLKAQQGIIDGKSPERLINIFKN